MANPTLNQPGKKTVEAGGGGPDEAAQSAREQSARASSDLARRTAESAQEALRVNLNTATESFQRIADQFTRVLGFSSPQSEELSRKSSQNLEAVSKASTVLAQGFQEISREWLGFAQKQFTRNMEAFNQLANCQSVQDVVAVQSGLVRDNMQEMIDNSRRVAEVSVRVADQASQTFQAKASSTSEQARHAA